MHAMPRLLALIVSLALAAPGRGSAEDAAPPAAAGTRAPPATPAQAAEVMVGEVIMLPYNRTASYGPTRVRGPNVNLQDGGDGEWKGNIKDFSGIFAVTEKRISGGSVNLVMDRDADGWICQGTLDGKRVRIAMEKDSLTARYDDRRYDLRRVASDLWATVPSGPGIRVKGDAAGADPYFPQFIFALLAVL
jgi:hypothetical protein